MVRLNSLNVGSKIWRRTLKCLSLFSILIFTVLCLSLYRDCLQISPEIYMNLSKLILNYGFPLFSGGDRAELIYLNLHISNFGDDPLLFLKSVFYNQLKAIINFRMPPQKVSGKNGK